MKVPTSGDKVDIEILRLKLEQIEARLALAKAQRKKKERKSQTMVPVQVSQSPEPSPPPRSSPRKFELIVAPIPASPQRVLLGIDRGKKASEVSLKNPFKQPTLPSDTTPPKGTSFASRMAELAQETKRKAEIQEDRQRKKAKSFSATALASQISKNPSETENGEEWCKYTGFNLRTRSLAQNVLREEFRGKTTYSVTDLYRLVIPPNYYPPEYDTPDFLVTGIVAAKSPVRQVKGREDGGNYLVVKIADLKVPTLLFAI
jgi:minichromosome maintenance protein 10